MFFVSVSVTILGQGLPNVIPPSPEAVSLFRYQDYPISYSTGLPQTEIPIYQVKSGSLSIPISLSYHSSGRKVSDETGSVGLGWTLNAGGRISRVVYGDADDNDAVIKFPSPWKKYADIHPTNDLRFLAGILNDMTESIPHYDTEYDVFYYNAPTIGGKFILKDDNNVKIPVLIPKKSYVIEYNQVQLSPTAKRFESITITDDMGIRYKFGADFETSNLSVGTTSPITSWMLNSITSPDGLDSIVFVYDHFYKERRSESQNIMIKDSWLNCSCFIGFDPDPIALTQHIFENNSVTIESYWVKLLTEIKFNEGKVNFVRYSGSERIKDIIVTNYNEDKILEVGLSYSLQDVNLNGNAPVYKLTDIDFKDNEGSVGQSYSFDYYSTVYPGSYSTVDYRFKDFWGYYNASGVTAMNVKIDDIVVAGYQQSFTTSIGYSYTSRNPLLTATLSGVLKKITYPTGGTTEFVYELNKYKDSRTQEIKNSGGLRIKTITTAEGIDVNNKTYAYGFGESGYGTLPLEPYPEYFSFLNYNLTYCGTGPDVDNSYRTRVYNADVLPLFHYYLDKPIVYQEVVEYSENTNSYNGKTLFRYDFDFDFAPVGGIEFHLHGFDYKYWKENSLILRTDYKRVNNVFEKVKSTGYEYGETRFEEEAVFGLKVRQLTLSVPSWITDIPGTGNVIPSYVYTGTKQTTCSDAYQDPYQVFEYVNYKISVAKKELLVTRDTLFSDAGNIIGVKHYEYNSYHLPSKVTTINSKGKSLVSEKKYPFNYSGITVLDDMVDLNMLNYPVESIDKSGTNPLRSVRTNYKNFGLSSLRIYPEEVEESLMGNSYQKSVNYFDYTSSGKIVSLAKANNYYLSYIWGYKNQHPIASIVNAPVKDVFHTSFEEDGNSTDAFTGRKSKTGGFSKALSGLTDGDYIFSYWKKIGSAWYFHSMVLNVIYGEINFGTTGHIDEVRFYPTNSQMTTYTYDPLIGMTSQCDLNNQVTYYEYDGFGRLNLVRDHDKNIIKKVCYNYTGQEESCLTYGNQIQTRSVRRNNCTGCQVGSNVTYTVPADTYFSTSQTASNALAQNEIDVNGQAYANANGNCTTPPNAGANSVNNTSYGVSLTFTNTCTNTSYYYTLNPNASASFGPFPQGTYHVNMSSSQSSNFSINGFSQSGVFTAFFYNIVIGGGASVFINN